MKSGIHFNHRKKEAFWTNFFAVLLMIFILIPFVWLIISSISSKVELSSVPPHWIPYKPSVDNFKKLLGMASSSNVSGEIPPFGTAMRNSLIVSATSNIFCLIIGIPAAYAFARLRFKMRNALMMTIIALRMLPEIALVLPLYMIMNKLGLSDSKSFLIIVYTSFVLPFVIWILESYFESIPEALEEAALLDGASRAQIILKVIIPLAVPGIITTCIFAMLTTWDEFLFALIFTNSYSAKTITVAISEFTTRHMIDYGMMTAGGILASLPPILVALLMQKYIITGLTEGSVKE